MEVSEAKRLRALEDENARLKKLLAKSMLDVSTLKDLLSEIADAWLAAHCPNLGDGAEGLLAVARVRVCRHEAHDVPLCQPAAGRFGDPAAATGVGSRAAAYRRLHNLLAWEGIH